MKIMFTTSHNIKKQHGASIITAIFLLVILALLGQGMVVLLATSHQAINHEVTSAKAYMSARTCSQWGMYQAVFTSPAGTYDHVFNTSTSNLFNTSCETYIKVTTADGNTYYDINTIAKFSSLSSPEYSRRELRLQFIP